MAHAVKNLTEKAEVYKYETSLPDINTSRRTDVAGQAKKKKGASEIQIKSAKIHDKRGESNFDIQSRIAQKIEKIEQERNMQSRLAQKIEQMEKEKERKHVTPLRVSFSKHVEDDEDREAFIKARIEKNLISPNQQSQAYQL